MQGEVREPPHFAPGLSLREAALKSFDAAQQPLPSSAHA
jgi:hypothetical protein